MALFARPGGRNRGRAPALAAGRRTEARGQRDVSAGYRRFGHEIQLERHLYTADQVASRIEAAGLREVCRLVRRAQGQERDDQAFLLARA